jgi:hypothetical protein
MVSAISKLLNGQPSMIDLLRKRRHPLSGGGLQWCDGVHGDNGKTMVRERDTREAYYWLARMLGLKSQQYCEAQ